MGVLDVGVFYKLYRNEQASRGGVCLLVPCISMTTPADFSRPLRTFMLSTSLKPQSYSLTLPSWRCGSLATSWFGRGRHPFNDLEHRLGKCPAWEDP